MKTVKNVYRKLSALVWKEKDMYVAKAVEVEVASQGKTKKEALLNLQEALALFFEDEPKLDFDFSFKKLALEKVNILHA